MCCRVGREDSRFWGARADADTRPLGLSTIVLSFEAGVLEARALNKLVDGVHSTDEALRFLAALQ